MRAYRARYDSYIHVEPKMRHRLDLALIGLAICSCSDATGSLQGGQAAIDPSGPSSSGSGAAQSGSSSSAGTVSGSSTGGGTGSSGATPTTATWSSLYAAYFGNQATAGCGSIGLVCHQGPGDSGVKVAPVSGFVCGTTAESCYAGMMAATPPLIKVSDAADPTNSLLYKVLWTGGPNGMYTDNMPQTLGYPFKPSDMALIAEWIKNGALNN